MKRGCGKSDSDHEYANGIGGTASASSIAYGLSGTDCYSQQAGSTTECLLRLPMNPVLSKNGPSGKAGEVQSLLGPWRRRRLGGFVWMWSCDRVALEGCLVVALARQ